jgi:hypothetical protein
VVFGTEIISGLMVRDARLCRALTMRIGVLAVKKALILRRPPTAAVSKDGRKETTRTNFVHMR